MHKNVYDFSELIFFRITKITGDLTITVTLAKSSETSDTDASDNATDSGEPTVPDVSDTDMPTPPDMSDTDRPTPPDISDTDRPTPPDMSDTDRPISTDMSDTDRPISTDMSDTDTTTDPTASDTDTYTLPYEPKENGIIGDVDGDGEITANDTLLVLRKRWLYHT